MKETSSHCLFENVHRRIRDATCSGTLKQNERQDRNLLAEQLNVSRQQMNPALILLKAQRFVTMLGGAE